MKHLFKTFLLLLPLFSFAENGYDLWLRYPKIENEGLRKKYVKELSSIVVEGNSPTINVLKKELTAGLAGLLSKVVKIDNSIQKNTSLVIAKTSIFINSDELNKLGEEGYIIRKNTKGNPKYIVTANTDIGLLYGTFHFLKLLQTNQNLDNVNITSAPKIKLRMLNHWDNLTRHVERGYAGWSIWNWHTLPDIIDRRYIDYARANASIGINGTVLTNVNANATILTPMYIAKVAALANTFRPYGIKVFLTARFSAPIEIGGLKTADPTDPTVQKWWNDKISEIYKSIPDFGGFVVKANSEGQPGPQNYSKDHADGANMLATALEPHHGIVMWRAFVYSAENADDRHKQAYSEFMPLDTRFKSNIMVQVKSGPIDFMPREPFHPLFGAMKKTPVMMEFQVTQEYLGQGTNMAFLGPLFEEVLKDDTYVNGKGSTVAKTLDGTIYPHALTGITGVANIGNDINWCGYQFGQANWYTLGRQAWDHTLTSDAIADEWVRMTFSNDNKFVTDVKKMMLGSREAVVNYMNPLGLHHIMATGHHYSPGPWVGNLNRPEWNPTYYHKADSIGIGFNRTSTGSNALAQYTVMAAKGWSDINTCDEKFLLWFHHVPWTHKMKSGRILWDELCYKYNEGVSQVDVMQATWQSMKGKVDEERYDQVTQHLALQAKDARWWKNACLLYFQTFAKRPLPEGLPQLEGTLDEYKKIRLQYAPGNGQ
jgi:alpha-glucuronidase